MGDTMKRIGLIGGMSWESTAHYYAIINEQVAQRLGGLHSADCVLSSVDFALIKGMQDAGEWDRAGEYLADRARTLELSGAEFLVVTTNTMHKVADQIQAAVSIPLLHLADATADAVLATPIRTVGLMGTRFTMEESFYIDRLAARGLTVIVPEKDQRDLINRVIFEELVLGIIRDESKVEYLEIVESLRSRGAEGVVLGCTEIELLIGQADTDLPLFATAEIHALAAVDFALAK